MELKSFALAIHHVWLHEKKNMLWFWRMRYKQGENEASNTDIQRALEDFFLYDMIFEIVLGSEGNGGLLV